MARRSAGEKADSAAGQLNEKQQRFVEEYIVDLNATQAAIRAGYSKKTAYRQGADLLRKPQIAAAITEANKQRSMRTEITADRVLAELACMGFADIRGIFTEGGALKDIASLPESVARAVQSVKVVTRPAGEKDDDGRSMIEYVHEIKLADKARPLELMGKHLEMFSDRMKHEASGALEEFLQSVSGSAEGSPMARLANKKGPTSGASGGED